MAKPRDKRIVPRVSPPITVLPGGTKRLGMPGVELTQAFDRANQIANALNIQQPSVGGTGGRPGQIGRPGAAGEDGEDGKDGNRWWVGEGFPAVTLGKPGDFYLDEDSCTILEKLENNDWVYVGELGCAGNQRIIGDPCEHIIWQPVVDSNGTFLITDWGGVVWAHRTLTCDNYLQWDIVSLRALTVLRPDGYYDVVVSDGHILVTYE